MQMTALQSGVAPDIVQKLMDAERDRVKLVSWSLFHHEALDMHPLESNITERTQVLEVSGPMLTEVIWINLRLSPSDRAVHHSCTILCAAMASAQTVCCRT